MRLVTALSALAAICVDISTGQQYAGDAIQNSLPGVPGSEITFFRVQDPLGKSKNLTLINYYSYGVGNKRLVESNIQRAVVVIHGLNRDPGTYMSNMLSALAQTTPSNPDVNFNSVAIMAPYFPNGDDKGTGYPWTDGLSAGRGSTSSALVWKSSQWSVGANNQYPYNSKTISSYMVLDQIVQYFDNITLFPNMKQIVVAGHSLGAQAVQRYAAIGNPLNTRTSVSYWVGNPNSYAWLSTTRPFSTRACPDYDDYRDGYSNFTDYPMAYGVGLVASGRAAILANFNSKAINYARGIQDLGDDSSGCAPFTTGKDRNERFFNFISAFPPACPDPSGRSCDTVDFINSGHDAGAMFASTAGQARIFLDNFNGTGTRFFDFGYPRQQTGDDPYPNPALNGTAASTNRNRYAGNMTYWGCWTDQDLKSLTTLAYNSNANTPERCTSTCAAINQSIAGLEATTQCYCGDSLGYKATQVIESSCQFPCPGNSSETCGGNNRLSVYSSGRPQVLGPPETPETVGNFYFTACYTEAPSGRALSGKGASGDFMTLEYCANFCSGYQYFGTEYSSECYCGNSLSIGANRTSSDDCSYLCANNSAQFCGGSNKLTVYQDPDWVDPSSILSTTTASATATVSNLAGPSATVSCPTSNNTIVASGGKDFTIECGIDHYGGDLASLSVSSFRQCIDTCSQNNKCVDVSLSGSACYLKSTFGAAISNSGVWGAVLVTSNIVSSSAMCTASSSLAEAGMSSSPLASSGSLSTFHASPTTRESSTTSPTVSSPALVCPDSNSTVFVSNGRSFFIECGIDHAGGDLRALSVTSFHQCIDTCATTPNCIDVSLSGSACYLKSSIGSSMFNGVWGAKALHDTVSSSATIGTVTSLVGTSSVNTGSVAGTSQSTSAFALSSTSEPSTIMGSPTAVSSTSSGVTTSTRTSDSPSLSSTTPISTHTSNSSSSVTSLANPPSTTATTPPIAVGPSTTFTVATSSSAVAALPSGFSTAGCFVDSAVRALPYSNGSSSTQTPQQCALNCEAQGYKYSGTEYASECWCGNAAPQVSVPLSDCSMMCKGDKTQKCGAGNRLSVVVDMSWKQTFFTVQQYRGPKYPTNDSGWYLKGCVAEGGSRRVLPTSVSLSNHGGASNATVGNCLDACWERDLYYCGLEYYSECWGGGVLAADSTSDGCDYPCKGNKSEACGGSNRLLVYEHGRGN